ncbi:hypothetical protein ACPWT1_10985 [Ramlibacter sp. MMS24-I3-19]|uniref:hypothetical protein n=1 Tax=Ramlibacter sp. MMS24-I3-19 TaxID=3416606 RepID=UPI003D094F05
MRPTILAIGMASLLLVACAADPAAGERAAIRDEGYIPTGSRIPRHDPKPSDIPAVSNGQLGTIVRGTGAAQPR